MFTIPTIFSAIDKLTAPVRKMQGAVRGFATTADVALSRNERLFRKLTPHLSEAGKQFMSFASTAAVAGAIVGGVTFSVKAIQDYETAVASFRTIVSDLDDQAFKPFQDKIVEVAKTTEMSATDTAKAFEKIAGLNATFAKTADGIGAVSQAAIILSKASGDELGASAESLVGIMNQFSFGADQANRTINVLAAGAGVGAASITQTSEAFVNFGSVAAGANITLEQSVGMIQTLGKFSIFGAEAGTKLRGSILRIQKAGIGYKSGQFQINDALLEAKARIDKLRTAKEKDAATLKIFGAENIATGKILLANIGTINDFTNGVTDTNAAQEQAAIRSATLAATIERLKNKFVNWITTSQEAKKAIDMAKSAIGFLSDNMSEIIKWIGIIVGGFLAWKTLLIATRIVMAAYNIVVGIAAVRSASLAVGVGSGTLAIQAQNVATKAIIAAQWLWNAAMTANPIGLVIVAIAALVAGIIYLNHQIDELNAKMKKDRASGTREEIKNVNRLLEANKQLSKQQAIQMEKKRLMARMAGIDAMVKDLSALSILTEEGRQKRMIYASEQQKTIGALQGVLALEKNVVGLDGKMVQQDKPIVDAKKSQNDAVINSLQEQTNHAKVDININDPNGKADAKTTSPLTKIKTTSTMKVNQS